MNEQRKSYPSDVSDEEWAFCVSYLTLMDEGAPQRVYPLREIFNALRYMVRAGFPWRMMPHDLPPWSVVYQQTRRWIKAGSFEAMVHDLRAILRLALERNADPSAVILDSRTLQSTPESGARGGFDGHKKRKGSKVHAAVDTLGHLLALRVTPANEQDRAQVGGLAQAVQAAVDQPVSWRLWIKVTRASSRPGRRLNKASSWKWSNIPKPNAASCSCPDAGWWSDPSLGRLASAAWPGIMNGSVQRWQPIIGSPSLPSCSTPYSAKVKYRL